MIACLTDWCLAHAIAFTRMHGSQDGARKRNPPDSKPRLMYAILLLCPPFSADISAAVRRLRSRKTSTESS